MSAVMFEWVENREKGEGGGREDEEHGGGGGGGEEEGPLTHPRNSHTGVCVCARDCNGHHQLSDIVNVMTVTTQVTVQMGPDGAAAPY